MRFSPSTPETLLNSRWLLPAAVALALAIGWLGGQLGEGVPGALLVGPPLVFFLVLVFNNPRRGFIAALVYAFVLSYFTRHLVNVPAGTALEIILLITWVAVLFHRTSPPDWSLIRNDLCRLTVIWFVINLLEVANPAGASLQGWFFELRGSALLWFLSVPLGFLVFNQKRDLNLFLYLIIGISIAGALYGIHQKANGVDAMEQLWLDKGGARTHVIWGQLRAFSFYSEAAQFGSSQAHVALICGILAVGPFSWTKRILLAGIALVLLYGMLVSGTRGAFFVLVVGAFVYLVLSKRVWILILGCFLAAGAFGVLKYTNIGDTNPNVFRMRSALNPNDPSLLVRLENQAILRDYMATRPFGGGMGVMGMWGQLYNRDKFLAKIAPDSYFVKVWGQYGIVGFIIWFGFMLYILGKCAGIVWRLRDPVLRQKLLALTAGYAGILMASYGNEIMNQVPSSLLLYTSWVFVFLGPKLDAPTPVIIKISPAAHG
ncbi:O-antigen ligase family protein [Hymenobacter sp. BT683]|uniref:O-antigen ligase family protein n=1 Tax=Hymenobacter jeongseonensis TaxID=2791027 RepID=A0ABS0IDR1_9BACT|nr:O-antigen ligase family protein [Hymenobacter jeongseonensis]MBF9236492.1 O-antigen ligase family protein [Hymenobacter jeongseonensis]